MIKKFTKLTPAKQLLVFLISFAIIGGGWFTYRSFAAVTWRNWIASYNEDLDQGEAAVPLGKYPVGTKMKVVYKRNTNQEKSVVVKSYTGGCDCFDLSDEDFKKLAPLSEGTIKVEVKKLD